MLNKNQVSNRMKLIVLMYIIAWFIPWGHLKKFNGDLAILYGFDAFQFSLLALIPEKNSSFFEFFLYGLPTLSNVFFLLGLLAYINGRKSFNSFLIAALIPIPIFLSKISDLGTDLINVYFSFWLWYFSFVFSAICVYSHTKEPSST